jgi:peptidoglycan L-alanyl-D-glutamate endopeptidase CwlK
MPKVNTKDVDPRLLEVIQIALKEYAFGGRIFSGYRTAGEQRELYATGISPVLMSQHMLGLAVDVVLYCPMQSTAKKRVADWRFPAYRAFNEIVQEIAHVKGLSITWGGEWKSRDGVHFQLEGVPPYKPLE